MEKEIIECMKGIGTYDESFYMTINILDGLLNDYEMARNEWIKDGCQIGLLNILTKMVKTNIVKNPLYQSMEKLRMDILSYSKELGLTPSGLGKLRQSSFDKDDTKISKVEEVLLKLSK